MPAEQYISNNKRNPGRFLFQSGWLFMVSKVSHLSEMSLVLGNLFPHLEGRHGILFFFGM